MAQHDYVIANQGFPAFRSDLNDALAAIVSNNSGASEPTTMFAHQIWVDTAANPSVLKIRNADNDAWITIGSIDQTGDTFTLVNLRTSGPVVFNDAGADVDFRVEGDTNANLLFVDASADAVGIGTSSPSSILHLSSTLPIITLTDTTQTSSSRIYQDEEQLAIDADSANAIAGTYISFRTDNSERMRIISSGSLIVGPFDADVINARTTVGAGNTRSLFTGWHSATTPTNGTLAFNVTSNGNVTNINGSYGTISDLKLKQDIVDAGSQWDDLKAIRIRKFRFKNDPDGVLQIGVIAQELEEVSPGLVSEHPDYEMVEVPVLDDDGNPVLDEEGNPTIRQEQQATGETTKSVKATVLYMKAVKALQEAMERIETLEAKVAALENA